MTENTQDTPSSGHYIKAVEAVEKILSDRGVTIPPCNICLTPQSFFLTDGYLFPPIFHTTDPVFHRGTSMPLISLCCSKCGNTVFMSSIVLGLSPLLFKKDEVPDGNSK